MKNLKWLVSGLFLAGVCSIANAVTVEIPLTCAGTYTFDNPYRESSFDAGVVFLSISHVYIDWSGNITGALVQNLHPVTFNPIGDPCPIDTGIYASLDSNPGLRRTEVWGGEASYPDPEIFDRQNEFTIDGTTTWSDLLDGAGKITLGYTELVILNGRYIQHGSIALDNATLMIDGTIAPEPASIMLLAVGVFALRAKYPT